MGQYHYLVNLDKRAIIHPHQIGNGLKLKEQVGRPYSTATALVMLLAASSKAGGRGGGDFRAQPPLVGWWAGDRIAFIGEYAEPTDISGHDAARIYQQVHVAFGADEHASKTERVESWVNISPRVREMMSAEFGITYVGSGWLDIVKTNGAGVTSTLAPDLVITCAESKRTAPA